MTAACRTPRPDSVTCVNMGEDGKEMRTGPALGPSGVWGAHGEPWLWQTEEMVMGFSFLPPSSRSVCSTSVTWAAFLRSTDRTFRIVPSPLLFQPLASAHICREGNKSFWQLLSRCWQPGAPSAAEDLSSVRRPCASLTRISILPPLQVRCLYSPSRRERSSFPGFTPFRARASWQPGGGGRSLFFWSSLSASWAGPWHRRRLITRVPLHRRVRRQSFKPPKCFTLFAELACV